MSLRSEIITLAGLLLAVGGGPTTPAAGSVLREPVASRPGQAGRLRVTEAYAHLPMSFEENQGQVDPAVRYLSRGAGYGLFLTTDEAVLAFRTPASGEHRPSSPTPGAGDTGPADEKRAVVRMRLVGANPTPRITAEKPLPARTNYLIGSDPSQWRLGVSSFAQVRYSEVYPGVDVVYYGNQRQLEYDFTVAPGADPAAIRLSFAGAQGMRIDESGDLVLQTAGGDVRQHRPRIYQDLAGTRKEIGGRYARRGMDEVGFEVAGYDRDRTLVIDPVLAYSTCLGGTGNDEAYAIATDKRGGAYVTGATESSDFPTRNASWGQRGWDAFIVKLDTNAQGDASLVYSTLVGGGASDVGRGIAVDGQGNAYVAGTTFASNFPALNTSVPAPLSSYSYADVFVVKLDRAGKPVYATRFGGADYDFGSAIAVDSGGNAFVTGETYSTTFPTTSDAYRPTKTWLGQQGFVAKLGTPDGPVALLYSTYFHDQGGEISAIAVDDAGHAYVTGQGGSLTFPTINAFQPRPGEAGDAFVAKLDTHRPGDEALVYSTFLGGEDYDQGLAIAADGVGHAYVAGQTCSVTFPVTPGAHQVQLAGLCDAFVAKLDTTATGTASLPYSTRLGGDGDERATGIAIDRVGHAYVTGFTSSTDFPTRNAYRASLEGTASDAFVTELDPVAGGDASLVHSTYLGGDAWEAAWGIAVDDTGIYVAGTTSSVDFAVVNGFQGHTGPTPSPYGGTFVLNDAFVARLMFDQPPQVSAGGPYAVDEGGSVTLTAVASDPEGGALAYDWDLDSDGTFELPNVDSTAAFSAGLLDGPSTRTVTVRVTDPAGLTATATATVEIRNVPPIASFTATPSHVILGQCVTLAFADPYDPGANDTSGGFLYSFDCNGDSSFEVENTPAPTSVCHATAAGTLTVHGRIADTSGGTTPYAATLFVSTAQETIQQVVVTTVDELVALGVLNKGQGNALVASANAAIAAIDRGNPQAAVNVLEALVNTLQADVKTGKIPADVGLALITATQQIIAVLQAEGVGGSCPVV